MKETVTKIFNMDESFKNFTVKDWLVLADEIVLHAKEECERKAKIETYKYNLENIIATYIQDIGIEETKKMIREINRNLRRVNENENSF